VEVDGVPVDDFDADSATFRRGAHVVMRLRA
jgi:hypothetical protein